MKTRSFALRSLLTIAFLCLIVFMVCPVTVLAAPGITNHNESSKGTKGNAIWSYHYKYTDGELHVIGTRSKDGEQYDFHNYDQKYGEIPSSNARKESGYTNVCGFPMDLTGCPYSAAQLESAIKDWAQKNGVDLTSANMMLLNGQKNVMLDLDDLFGGDPPDDTPDPPHRDDPTPDTYNKYETDSVWRLVDLSVNVDARQLNVNNGKIDWNKKEGAGDNQYRANSIGSAESAYAGVPSLDISGSQPTFFHANTDAKATYIEVFRRRHYTRHDVYETYHCSDKNCGGHSRWVGYSPWALADTVYWFGGTTTTGDSDSYDANIQDPEMKLLNPLDLTSETYIDAGICDIDYSSDRIKDCSGSGNIAATITDKSGLHAGEKFSITSENIPQSFTTKNEGWWGITSAAGPGSLSLGEESPNGNVGHQFVSEVTLNYGPYTQCNNDSTKRCSIELLREETASDGEQTGQYGFSIANDGEKVVKALWKERSIKYGEDYLLGYKQANCFWSLVVDNRQNHEGYDYASHAEGNSVSCEVHATNTNYNNIILVADFIQPYLYGEFEVKDVAGSNH